ncbi:hypothetical protein C8R47DRAFT_1206139 [Mycena vitilis]|nr:hypothetical protein C8R47DRAFT_1206139 [Mycena vitilis]
MRFTLSIVAVLAIALAPTYAAVVSGSTKNTAVSVGAGQIIAPQGENNTLHCFGPGSYFVRFTIFITDGRSDDGKANSGGMLKLAERFCEDNARQILKFPDGYVNGAGYVNTYLVAGAAYSYFVPIRMRVQADNGVNRVKHRWGELSVLADHMEAINVYQLSVAGLLCTLLT